MAAASDLSVALQRQRVDPQTGEVLFSLEQVKDIVRRAVDEKERQIRDQYDRILQQKLQGALTLPLLDGFPLRACPTPAVWPHVLRLTRRLLSAASSAYSHCMSFLCVVQIPFPSHPCICMRTEQYQAFAKFNEDYISRSLKSKCPSTHPPSPRMWACWPARISDSLFAQRSKCTFSVCAQRLGLHLVGAGNVPHLQFWQPEEGS